MARDLYEWGFEHGATPERHVHADGCGHDGNGVDREFYRGWQDGRKARAASQERPQPECPPLPECDHAADCICIECDHTHCCGNRRVEYLASQERPQPSEWETFTDGDGGIGVRERPSIDVERLAFALHEHFSEPEGQTCWHDQDAERVVRIYENAREYGLLSERPPTRSDE